MDNIFFRDVLSRWKSRGGETTKLTKLTKLTKSLRKVQITLNEWIWVHELLNSSPFMSEKNVCPKNYGLTRQNCIHYWNFMIFFYVTCFATFIAETSLKKGFKVSQKPQNLIWLPLNHFLCVLNAHLMSIELQQWKK